MDHLERERKSIKVMENSKRKEEYEIIRLRKYINREIVRVRNREIGKGEVI